MRALYRLSYSMCGRGGGNRTRDFHTACKALYQLSYSATAVETMPWMIQPAKGFRRSPKCRRAVPCPMFGTGAPPSY